MACDAGGTGAGANPGRSDPRPDLDAVGAQGRIERGRVARVAPRVDPGIRTR